MHNVPKHLDHLLLNPISSCEETFVCMIQCLCICLQQTSLFNSFQNSIEGGTIFAWFHLLWVSELKSAHVVYCNSNLISPLLSSLELGIDPYISFYPRATKHLAALSATRNQSLIPVTQKSGVSLALGNPLPQKRCLSLDLTMHIRLPTCPERKVYENVLPLICIVRSLDCCVKWSVCSLLGIALAELSHPHWIDGRSC